jgi:NADH:ubiquinone oxidoreductase subunit B-like Fe-S oxidoreductase
VKKIVSIIDALVDVLLYLVLIGGAVAICGAILSGICRLITKIRELDHRKSWEDQRVHESRQYMRKTLGQAK